MTSGLLGEAKASGRRQTWVWPCGFCHKKADKMVSALDLHAARQGPCGSGGGLTGHFLAEPERPLGLLRASISYSPQPVFNTKRGKGGIKGAGKEVCS